MQRMIRRAVLFATMAVVSLIVVPVVGQFSIELARERGLYDHPAETLVAVVTASRDFVTQPSILYLATLLIGLTIGLWFDWFLRGREPLIIQSRGSDTSRRDLAKKLDEPFREGVRIRNRIQNARPMVRPQEYQVERKTMVEWSNRVEQLLDSEHITVKEQSHFQTLYNLGKDDRVPQLGPFQTHLVTMWNRKLDTLRAIIDRIGD